MSRLNPESFLRRCFRGHALNETGMGIVLIAVVTMPAVALFGDQLSPVVEDMRERMSEQPATSVASVQAKSTPVTVTDPVTGQVTTALPVAPPAPNPDQTSISVTLVNGKTLLLQGYPQDLSKMVESSGANGTTVQLANMLISLAEQLEASGEIPAETKNTIVAMANQGYEIAYIEGLIESASNATSNNNGFMDTPVKYHGASMTVQDMANLIGFSNTHLGSSDALDPNGAYPALEKFLNLYVQVDKSGTVKDPAARLAMEALVSEIALLSEDVEGLTAAYMDELLPSQVSKRNSSSICKMGNGKAVGLLCSS
ncbi:MAG: hypothetical protein AB7P76_00690 [Candidatus Melainabacteria bacterium]